MLPNVPKVQVILANSPDGKQCLEILFELILQALIFFFNILGKSISIYENTDAIVKTMTRSGNVVYLPFDLRVPLARYVVRSKITNLKRFNIATVFR